MKQVKNNGRSIIATSSITYAIKGQKALSINSIRSRVIKLDANQTKKGCAYGIEVDNLDLNNAVHIFNKSGIPYSEVIEGLING